MSRFTNDIANGLGYIATIPFKAANYIAAPVSNALGSRSNPDYRYERAQLKTDPNNPNIQYVNPSYAATADTSINMLGNYVADYFGSDEAIERQKYIDQIINAPKKGEKGHIPTVPGYNPVAHMNAVLQRPVNELPKIKANDYVRSRVSLGNEY